MSYLKKWFSVSNIEHKELVTQMRMAKFKENGTSWIKKKQEPVHLIFSILPD